MFERLYKRGAIWYARIYLPDGRRSRISTQCTDRRAAEAALRDFERRAQGSTDSATHTPAHTVADALNYLVDKGAADVAPGTVRMYIEKGGHLVRLLGEHDVNGLTSDGLLSYIHQRLNEGAARETVRKELSTLRRALTLAKERRLMQSEPRNVFPSFRVRYQPRQRYLTQEEVVKLLGQLPSQWQLWVMIAILTGGRDSEVDGLRWEQIDFDRSTVFLSGTKTAKSRRTIPLPSLLAQWLLPRRQPTGLVVGDWPNVRRDLAAACERAGIDRVSPNDLRRTYASWLKQNGIDSYIVAQLLGHTTARMVELVYGRLDIVTLSRAVSTLPGGNDCVCGVSDTSISMSQMTRMSQTTSPQPIEMLTTVVPKPGIEPGTRGFSVRCSTS